jgi:hypothetical protein
VRCGMLATSCQQAHFFSRLAAHWTPLMARGGALSPPSGTKC